MRVQQLCVHNGLKPDSRDVILDPLITRALYGGSHRSLGKKKCRCPTCHVSCVLFKIESSAPCRGGGAGLGAPLPFIMQQLTQEGKAAHAARLGAPPAAPGAGRARQGPGAGRAPAGPREAPPGPAPVRGGTGRCRAPLAAGGESAVPAPAGPRPRRVLHLVPGPGCRPRAAAAAAVFTERSRAGITPLAWRRRRRCGRRAFDHCDGGGRRSSSRHGTAKR